VLDSIHPVIERSRDVQTDVNKIAEVASWMAYEELPIPDYALPFGIGTGDVDETIGFIFSTACIDTAFTDFCNVKFQADYAGRNWSDSETLFACMKRAIDQGVPILDGAFLEKITRADGNPVRRQYRAAHAGREDANLAPGWSGAGSEVRRPLFTIL
jgi:hypothetical protein